MSESKKEQLKPFGQRLSQALEDILKEDPGLSAGAVFIHSRDWDCYYYETREMTADDAIQLINGVYKSFGIDPGPFINTFAMILVMQARGKDGEPGMPAGGWGES